MPSKFGWLIIVSALTVADTASAQQNYQSPPAPIADILAAPPPPSASLSPTRDRLALATDARFIEARRAMMQFLYARHRNPSEAA